MVITVRVVHSLGGIETRRHNKTPWQVVALASEEVEEEVFLSGSPSDSAQPGSAPIGAHGKK